MFKNVIGIDWIHLKIKITHEANLISNGVTIHLNQDLDYNTATHNFKPMILRSSYEDTLWVKPNTSGSIEISGNFYKWLNHQNITGSNDLIGLVVNVVNQLMTMSLGLNPTEQELNDIKKGRFRLYRVDINKALLFDSKQEALNYLSHIKENATYPYKAKTIESNGAYFGKRSKRWNLKFYHKGNEVRSHKKAGFLISDELLAYADLMIRTEIKINSKQLTEWELLFGYQWHENIGEILISKKLQALQLPEIKKQVIDNEQIKNKAHRKFYSLWKSGEYELYYSQSTIYRMKNVFLKEYSISINTLKTINQESK